MKRIIIFLGILIIHLNVSSQSSWGILGKATGILLESTSKNSEWQTVGKILQTAGDMQYELDKTKIENEKTYNYNINNTNNQTSTGYSKMNVPEHVVIKNNQYKPEKGYAWVNTFDKNDLSVKKIELSIDNKVEKLNNKSVSAFDNGKLSESIIYSTQSINLKPNRDAYFIRILANYTLKNYNESLEDLNLVLDYFTEENYNIQFISFFEIRGNVYFEKGNIDKAMYNYNKALEIECLLEECNSVKAEIYGNRANIKLMQNDYKGALEDCDMAITLDPNNSALVLNVKGMIYIQKQDYNNALYCFNEAIQNLPEVTLAQGLFAVLYTNRALSELVIKDYKSSIYSSNKAIEYDYKYSKAYIARGAAKIEMGITESACSDFKKALKFGNDTASELISKYCK